MSRMETRLTLRPGMPGTKKRLEKYRDRLVCVRYLYNEASGRRLKTVELVVEEIPWSGKPRRPRRHDDDMVAIRVAWDEHELRNTIKLAGAIWRPRHKLWEIEWRIVRKLKLQARVSTEQIAPAKAPETL